MSAGQAGERTRAPNRWGEGQRLRQEILDAASRLLQDGTRLEEITLRAIAREAGIAAPSVYKHFSGKDELMWAVLDASYAELAGTMRAAARTAPAGDPWAALRATVDAYCRFATEERPRYQLIFHMAATLPEEHQPERHPLLRVLDVWREAVGNYLDSRNAAGCEMPGTGTSAQASNRAAQLLWTGLHGQFGLWWSRSRADPEQQMLDLRDTLLLTLFGQC
jgi:AcrR family transcriptional regulator